MQSTLKIGIEKSQRNFRLQDQLVEDAIASLTEPAVLQPESFEHAGAERALLLLGKQTPGKKYGAQDQVNTVIRCAQL